MKCVKVIVAAVNLNRFERPASQMKYPHHPQWRIDLHEQLRMWAVQRAAMQIDGGMDFDTLVVCNGWDAYLHWKDFDGMKTANGVLKVVWRENSGGSFGGYNWAFRNTDYDGFIFTEDDIIVAGKDYYKVLVDTIHSENRVGYVCLIGASRNEETRHCHGGVGFTTRKRLRTNVDRNGDLPHPHRIGWDQREAIRKGEIPFTSGIRERGYKLVVIPGMTRQWSFENLCKPYWCLDSEDYKYLGYTD